MATVFDGNTASYVAIASAIAAGAAAYGAFVQVNAVKRATLAELFLAFSERYNHSDMATALRELAAWYRSTPDTRFDDWINAKRAGDANALKLNVHRRLVSRFYFDVARLRYLELIKPRYAREIIENNGLNIFYKVCEPMNLLNHPHTIDRYAATLRNVCKQYADGEIYESAPAPKPRPPSMWVRAWRALLSRLKPSRAASA